MPTPAHINEGLAAIANGALPLAVAWHVVFLLFGIALVGGWRPSRRVAGAMLAVPLVSVGILSWWFANPFNAAVFGVLALALLVAASRMGTARGRRGPSWMTALGVLTVAFGWTYPHFLEGASWLRYLYGAPSGLVPCPTLAIVVGLTLVWDGLGSRRWAITVGLAGVFYAVLGTLRLGVAIDLLLLIGAAALIVHALLRGSMRARPRAA